MLAGIVPVGIASVRIGTCTPYLGQLAYVTTIPSYVMSGKNRLFKSGKIIRLRWDFCRRRISAGFGSAGFRPEPKSLEIYYKQPVGIRLISLCFFAVLSLAKYGFWWL